MIELQESVKKYGILNPLIVRPRKDGTYEIISGHRRKIGSTGDCRYSGDRNRKNTFVSKFTCMGAGKVLRIHRMEFLKWLDENREGVC